MRHWGGPLSRDWREGQAQLQLKILQRQREFGMISVLPGFAGHGILETSISSLFLHFIFFFFFLPAVPEALKLHYPNASITRSPNWGKFPEEDCCVYLLDPVDPLYHELGKEMVDILTTEFGTDHIYNADTFNVCYC